MHDTVLAVNVTLLYRNFVNCIIVGKRYILIVEHTELLVRAVGRDKVL